MPKEILTIDNFDNGNLKARINEAIISTNAALDNLNTTKAAKITIEIGIAPTGDDGFFRKVTSNVKVTLPAIPAKMEIIPVHHIDGKRTMVAEPVTPPVKQESLPNIASIKRAVM